VSVGGLPDVYTLRARIMPVLIVSIPVALMAFALVPQALGTWSGFGIGGAVWLGVSAILAQAGRDAGRRRQIDLFKLWDGSPTTKRLRHRETQNATQLQRRHAQLAAITGLTLPTSEEEAHDPAKADEIYETCGSVMREKTRDRKLFDVVFDENCSYGFRRNLWGLKPFGVAVGTAVLVVAAGYVGVGFVRTGIFTASDPLIAVAIVCVIALLGWSFVTPCWVRLPADAYAEALLAACERVMAGKPAQSKRSRTTSQTRGRT